MFEPAPIPEYNVGIADVSVVMSKTGKELMQGIIDMNKFYDACPVVLTFNLQDAIPHAMRSQTRNQISTPMMTLIGSVSHVSKQICAM